MGEVTRNLELPYPPTVNTYWRRVGFKTIVSKRGRDYRDQVRAILEESVYKQTTEQVELRILLYMPDKRRRDIDNVLKALLDSLEYGGALENDNQVWKLIIERAGFVKGGMVVLEIIEGSRQKETHE